MVLELITTLDLDFASRLTQSVDLCEYSVKLSKHARFVVACIEEKIAGIIAFYENTSTGELYVPYVCTNENYRKQGVANSLLNKLIEFADSISYNIALEVLRTNHVAISLYGKFGFQICNENDIKYYMKRLSKFD